MEIDFTGKGFSDFNVDSHPQEVYTARASESIVASFYHGYLRPFQ